MKLLVANLASRSPDAVHQPCLFYTEYKFSKVSTIYDISTVLNAFECVSFLGFFAVVHWQFDRL